MTINEYQTEALRTAAGMNHPNNDEILLNGVMGLCGESGECVDIFYISNSKCYATDPSNTEGRPAIVVSSDKLNEHADVVEVVYLTTKEKRLMPTHAEVLCKIPSTALCETIYTVNKDRLGDFVRTCTDKEMEGVNAGILCSLGIAAPVVDGEPVDNSVTVERNLYKHLYEDLLNKVMAR